MSATITLLGNVGKEPSSDYVGSTNTHRVRFSLAVNRKKGSEELTDWYDVVTFGKLADTAEKYVTKGSKLLVVGKLEVNRKDDGKTFLDVSAFSFTFAGPKVDAQTPAGFGASPRGGNAPVVDEPEGDLPW